MILTFSCEHPFLHEKGPEQRLRALNTTNLRQISLRVFYMFPRLFHVRKSWKSQKQVQKIEERVISEKKGPCQATAGCRPNGFSPKSTDFQVLGRFPGLAPKTYPIPKMIRPTMMPWPASMNWRTPNLSFVRTCRKFRIRCQMRHLKSPENQ